MHQQTSLSLSPREICLLEIYLSWIHLGFWYGVNKKAYYFPLPWKSVSKCNYKSYGSHQAWKNILLPTRRLKIRKLLLFKSLLDVFCESRVSLTQPGKNKDLWQNPIKSGCLTIQHQKLFWYRCTGEFWRRNKKPGKLVNRPQACERHLQDYSSTCIHYPLCCLHKW